MYKFWHDKDNNIIHINITGPQKKASLTKAKEEFIHLLKELPGWIDILVDCRDAELDIALFKENNVDSESLILTQEKIRHVAVFGLSPLQRLKLKMIINLGGFDKISFFDNKDDALNWIATETRKHG